MAGRVLAGIFKGTHLQKSVAGSVDVTLTDDEAKNLVLEFTGVLGANINVILPLATAGHVWHIINSTTGNFTLTVKTGAGTGVVITQGAVGIVRSDGTNLKRCVPDLGAGAALYLSSLIGLNSTLALGRLSKSVAGSSNVTLTALEYCYPLLEFTGVLTGSISVIVPLTAGSFFLVFNNTTGAFALTVKGATGSGIVVRQGCRALLYADGTNVVRLTPDCENDGDISPPQVNDANGNEVLKFGSVASAVNELTATNAATGNAPVVSATGNDANIDIGFSPKGTGQLTSSADCSFGGGYRQTVDGWYQDDVPASQAGVLLSRFGAGAAFATKWIAPRAGSVTAVLVKSNAARIAGTLTVEVFKNGSGTGLTAVIDGTNTTVKATTQAKDADTFVAGDELDIRITTDGSWSPTTADIRASLEVET